MKTLLAFFAVALAVSACKPKGSQQESSSSRPASTQAATAAGRSLNNIDEHSALRMIEDYVSRGPKDTRPKPKSIWFSKDMIHNIVFLLHEEIKARLAQDPHATDLPDGFRIYFASDTAVLTYPLKTSVILVSTKDNGPCISVKACKSGRKHIDYYDHSLSADLFHMGDIAGQPCDGGSGCTGAALYRTCFCGDDLTCPSLPHNLTREFAEEMVQGFKRRAAGLLTSGEWFDLGLLEAIDEDTTKRHNGIRIYFARNPKSDDYESERDAFVISTTEYKSASGNTEDYFDCGIAATYRRKYLKKFPDKAFSPGKDKGELCPDNCN
jgi:hypothetical protein